MSQADDDRKNVPGSWLNTGPASRFKTKGASCPKPDQSSVRVIGTSPAGTASATGSPGSPRPPSKTGSSESPLVTLTDLLHELGKQSLRELKPKSYFVATRSKESHHVRSLVIKWGILGEGSGVECGFWGWTYLDDNDGFLTWPAINTWDLIRIVLFVYETSEGKCIPFTA